MTNSMKDELGVPEIVDRRTFQAEQDELRPLFRSQSAVPAPTQHVRARREYSGAVGLN